MKSDAVAAATGQKSAIRELLLGGTTSIGRIRASYVHQPPDSVVWLRHYHGPLSPEVMVASLQIRASGNRLFPTVTELE